jgi:hypothetical protein
MSVSKPPPPGVYVPAVLFFNEDEELDEGAIKSHILRLAQVLKLDIYIPLVALIAAILYRDPLLGSSFRDRTERRSTFRTMNANAQSV